MHILGSYTVICNLHKGALNKKNKNTVYTNNTYHIKMEKCHKILCRVK